MAHKITIPRTVSQLGHALEVGFVNPKGKTIRFKWDRIKMSEARTVKGEPVYYLGAGRDVRLFCDVSGRKLFIAVIKAVNPSRTGITPEVKKAAALWEAWSDFAADSAEWLDIKPGPLLYQGEGINIDYTSDKWTAQPTDYTHAFESPVEVYADNHLDPQTVAIIGPDIRITPRGIEG